MNHEFYQCDPWGGVIESNGKIFVFFAAFPIKAFRHELRWDALRVYLRRPKERVVYPLREGQIVYFRATAHQKNFVDIPIRHVGEGSILLWREDIPFWDRVFAWEFAFICRPCQWIDQIGEVCTPQRGIA